MTVRNPCVNYKIGPLNLSAVVHSLRTRSIGGVGLRLGLGLLGVKSHQKKIGVGKKWPSKTGTNIRGSF